MKFKNLFNYVEYKGQVNNQPSLTVPDQAMTIKDILTRFSRGLPVGGFPTLYDDIDSPDDFLPDPRTLDLAERQQYTEMVQEELNHLRSQQQPAETVGLTKTENEG